MGIFDAALLRLLRIFPDGDWTWTYPWIQIPDKLQEPILCHFLHGFLAQMAYHTQQMVPGICLYPTGWKPQRAETYDSQYIYRVVTHRPVAWRGLELYYMGHVLLRAADRRELFLLDKLERHAILSHIYMLIVIPVSWTIFNISDLPTLGNYIKRLFFLPVKGSVKIDTFPKFLELFGTYWWLLAICAICCTPIPIRLLKRFYKTWVCKILIAGTLLAFGLSDCLRCK